MMEAEKIQFPPRIAKGDKVALITPAGPVERERLEWARDFLTARGLEVSLRPDAHSRVEYLAGSDHRRLEELRGVLYDPGIKAIFCARGGYGVQRILQLLDLSEPPPPKAVVGFSDNTALLSYLNRKLGWAVLHGPHPEPESENTFGEVLSLLGLEGEPVRQKFAGLRTINPGPVVTAPVTGGCLSIISSGIGTPHGVDARGCILFIEDVNEPVYKVDRLLHHLKWAGVLDSVSALLIGKPESFLPGDTDPEPLNAMLKTFAAELDVPVVTGMPCGHVEAHRPLPFGPLARLDPDGGTLEFIEDFTK